MFKVRAVNAAGKGKASDVSDAVCAKALPGNYTVLTLCCSTLLVCYVPV